MHNRNGYPSDQHQMETEVIHRYIYNKGISTDIPAEYEVKDDEDLCT